MVYASELKYKLFPDFYTHFPDGLISVKAAINK